MQREWLFGTFLGVQWKQFWTSLAQEIDVHDIVISSFHQIAIDLVNVAACQGVSEQAETQNPSISHIHADETTDACCMLMNIWPLYRVCSCRRCVVLGAETNGLGPFWFGNPSSLQRNEKDPDRKVITIGQLGQIRPPYQSMGKLSIFFFNFQFQVEILYLLN